MRAKLIREFLKTGDIPGSLGIGQKSEVIKWFDNLGIPRNMYEFDGNKIVFNGNLFINEQIDTFPENLHIIGNLSINRSNLKKISDSTYIEGGGLFVNYSLAMKEFPKNIKKLNFLSLFYTGIKKLNDNMVIYEMKLEGNNSLTKLPNNLMISDSLSIKKSKINELPRDLYIGGSLILNITKIKEIPDSVFIGKNIIIRNNKSNHDLIEWIKQSETFKDKLNIINYDF